MIADYFYRSKKNFFLKIPHLMYLVVRTGKLAEFSSFCWWELKDKLGFYRKKYISIANNHKHIDISTYTSTLQFTENTFFKKCAIQYRSYFKCPNGDVYFSKNEEPSVLYVQIAKTDNIKKLYDFGADVICLFVDKANSIFVCVEQHIFRASFDNNYNLTFEKVLDFVAETGYLRTNFSYTETPTGDLFCAEYAAVYHDGDKSRHRRYTKAYKYFDNPIGKQGWECVAYLYHSTDDGKAWNKYDFLKRNGTNKHIHIIQWSDMLNGLVLTDGDNTKHIYFNKSSNFSELTNNIDTGWKDLTIRHINKGGYTSMIECTDCVIFGTDYMGGTNFFRRTKDLKNYDEQIIPNPYRRCIIDSMTIVTKDDKEYIFANLLCSYSDKYHSKILLSTDSGKTWTSILEYDGFKVFVDILNNNHAEDDKLYLLITDTNEKCVTYQFEF